MRTQFIQPAKLDGKQLIAELNAGGVVCTELPNVDSDGNFWLDIDEADVAKATPIVAAHVAVPYVDPDAATKASIGAKMSSPTYQPLNAAEVAFLAKAIS